VGDIGLLAIVAVLLGFVLVASSPVAAVVRGLRRRAHDAQPGSRFRSFGRELPEAPQ
jgi:hypothetical protein